MSHVPNLFSAMPGHTPYACPSCVYGEGAHSEWCPERPSACLDRIDAILAEHEEDCLCFDCHAKALNSL